VAKYLEINTIAGIRVKVDRHKTMNKIPTRTNINNAKNNTTHKKQQQTPNRIKTTIYLNMDTKLYLN
jgi:hypothetical protein